MPSPLRGANIEELGVRFPDMSHIYDEDLQTIVRKTALNNDIPLKDGVYLQLSGPQYESPAEITMARTLGRGCGWNEHSMVRRLRQIIWE